ncbi:MAG: hypothetical protein EZS28_016217 [Streblomastix strix]|uniref:Uncharacterized protein n=1 Tax=Streblomastix strix TaxID=222440 RepID=A0A5J4W1D8_9EUKA|nr:MAG: hypothetical protein EZS28_016217 [Streblomastix strix]
MLHRKVNFHPCADERKTDIRIDKSRPSQLVSRPILRNRDRIRTIDSVDGDVNTIPDRIIILLGTTDTKTMDITTIPGIWQVPSNITISGFSVTKPFLTGPTFFRLYHIIIQIDKHH